MALSLVKFSGEINRLLIITMFLVLWPLNYDLLKSRGLAAIKSFACHVAARSNVHHC